MNPAASSSNGYIQMMSGEQVYLTRSHHVHGKLLDVPYTSILQTSHGPNKTAHLHTQIMWRNSRAQTSTMASAALKIVLTPEGKM